ncbi:hypothetical protein [Streptomyces sp. AD55]|uniref:putative phage holin n=1 Tax=Streptomyces sp. AD55 TaxID=3242895 RepID=UPI0035279225
MTWAQTANTAASGLVALACMVFVVVYHVHAPWRSTPVGRHLMMFTLTVGALGLYTVLITIWPEGQAASVLRTMRTTLLVVVAALVVQRTRMVLRAQHDGPLQHAADGDVSGPSSS